MSNYLAGANDVRLEIDTELEDTEIEKLLARVARDIERRYAADDGTLDGVFEDDAHRRDFEAVLTAHRIATGRDRRAQTESVASVNVTYETSEVAKLERDLAMLDPIGDFVPAPSADVVRNGDRHVRSTDRNSDR